MKKFFDMISHNRAIFSGFSQESKRIIIAILISAVGNGLVLPYLFIYLHVVRGISPLLTGICAGSGGAISLICAPLMGTLIDHFGAKKILYLGLAFSTFGFGSFIFIHNFWTALFAIMIEAIGGVALWPAQSALALQHINTEHQENFFGMQFAALNLGIGIGGVISSQIIRNMSIKSFQSLYLLDAITFVFYGFAIFKVKSTIQPKPEEDEAIGWSGVLKDKKFIEFWLIAVFAIFLGYSQLELGFTSFANTMAKVHPSGIAIAFAVNTALIVFFQLPILSWVKKFENQKAVSIALAFWALAWIMLAIAVPLRSFAIWGVIACQAVFGIGEMIWSPLAPAIVNKLAPNHLRGRYNSMMGITWQIGALLGPVFVGLFINFHLQWLWVVTLVFGLTVLSLLTLRLKLGEE